jgi:hypothetical protein
MNRCDKCQAPLNSSPMLISGIIVFFCKPCARFRLQSDDQWFDGGTGIVNRLLARAAVIKSAGEQQPEWS